MTIHRGIGCAIVLVLLVLVLVYGIRGSTPTTRICMNQENLNHTTSTIGRCTLRRSLLIADPIIDQDVR
jgi:hypothetical protein